MTVPEIDARWHFAIVVGMICLHVGFFMAGWTEAWIIRGIRDLRPRPVLTFVCIIPFALLSILLLSLMSLASLPGGAGTAADGLVAPVLHLSKGDRMWVLIVCLFFSFLSVVVLLGRQHRTVQLFSALFLFWFAVEAYLITLIHRTSM